MRGFIQQIFDVSPNATPLMEQVNQQSEALRAMVDQLATTSQSQAQELQALSGDISSKMDGLRGKLEEYKGAVDEEKAATEARVSELKDTIREIKDGVIGALEGAQQQMQSFREHVDTGREMVESANEAAQNVISQVNDHIENGRQLLHQATDFGNEKIDEMQAMIDDTFEFAESTATDLLNRMEANMRDTGAKVEEMTGVSFEDLGSAFGTGVEMLQGNVFENGANMLMDMLQEKIEEQARQIVDQLLDRMIETLGSIKESLFGNAEEAGLERKALEPILAALDDILDPLFSATDHLKGMAAMVGIDV